MFGEQFYPTPEAVIEKMVEPYGGEMLKGGINGRYKDTKCYGLLDKTILDPSAGKGDILKFVAHDLEDYARNLSCDMYAIEIDENLQSILKDDKNISVIGNDFLSYEQDVFFDVILMNPPFKNGDAHLLKAIEIAHDTDIVCLLNAETLLNPHTLRRKELLAKIEEFGSFEILGNVFETAERKTDVNVALVRIHVTKEGQSFDFDFSDYEPQKVQFDESFIKNELARADMVGNMMIQFEQAKKAFKEYIEAQKKWEHYTSFLLDSSKYDKAENYDKKDLSPLKRYNHFNNGIKKTMWRQVITELGLQRYMTSAIQRNFDIFIQQHSSMSFTKENVRKLFEMLVMNSTSILEQSIIDVFDMLTENYYSENRLYREGWKTNDRYFVNQKVIAPTYIRHGEYMNSYDKKQYGDRFSLGYHGENKYTDIDKMLCYLSGKRYESILTIRQALEHHFNVIGKIKTGDKYDNTCQSTFFDIKFFKKGTVHLKFRDKFIWQEFNMRACSGKNWLPDNERTEWERKKKQRREAKKNKNILRIGEEPPMDEANPKTKKRKPVKIKKKELPEFSNQLLNLFGAQVPQH